MTESFGQRRILLLTSTIPPYRLASFRALAREPGIDLMVGFSREEDPRHPWMPSRVLGFPHFILQGPMKSWRTMAVVKRQRPDVIIVGGWDHLSYWFATIVGHILGLRVVIWIESTTRDCRTGSLPREWAKRRIVRSSHGVIVPGSAAQSYARSLGATRVVVAANSIDNASFRPADALSQSRTPTVLFVGRLAPEKGVDVLLRAWKAVEQAEQARLVIIGSGPEALRLQTLSDGLSLSNVEWVPFLQPDELATHYRRAHMLVLPSRSEPWGFVVNEAMASGLPVIVTRQVGSAMDLVLDGTTGFVIPSDNPAALAETVRRLLANPNLRRAMAQRALAHISSYTPKRWASAVANLVRGLT